MAAGLLGCMTTPAQGNRIPDGCDIGADNGKFGKGWPGPDAWWDDLNKKVKRYGADRFALAVAPDVPFDAVGTLAESRPWLQKIRDLGIPAAFAAQNGSENGLIPWDEADVVFLAGDDEWKDGPAAEAVAVEAKERGLWVHMGRVNTRGRLRRAEWFGCDSADGTTLAFGPEKNLRSMLLWLDDLNRRPSLRGGAA